MLLISLFDILCFLPIKNATKLPKIFIRFDFVSLSSKNLDTMITIFSLPLSTTAKIPLNNVNDNIGKRNSEIL